MVRAMAPDAETRAAARETLRDGLYDDMGTWREAWRRAALGRSLLLEDDEGARLDGLFELVNLPARFSRSQGYLCGVALATMSDEAQRRGDPRAAALLRAELESRHPGHPGLRWLDERDRAARADGAVDADREDTESQESERIDEHD